MVAGMTVKHDRLLAIAVGNSRKTKTWKNKKVMWSELLDKLGTVTRTAETQAEYFAMGRERQSDIKDVGGFVGGYCENGNRTAVKLRSVLCLDADFATSSLWEDWGMLYGSAAAVYSTHKHKPDAQRLRLVVPLARDVDPDEYGAVGRRIAADLGIDQFDDTSFEPQRLMYWPSASSDGEYIFAYHDGPLVDPDAVLSTYQDWRDVSCWPMSSRVSEIVKKAADKQQDPTTKKGLIGAFCRAYPIREAIAAFVPDYAPCDDPGRYTYTKGSTAAGVIIYDDNFSYSHHATDPASGQLCNSWDLVRLHKYAELDADCDPKAPPASRPSYKAMTALAAADPLVVSQSVSDRLAEAGDDYAQPVEAPDDWKKLLRLTDKGMVAQTIENVVVILGHDPRLSGCLGVNEMTHDIVAVKSLPWRKVDGESQWSDADDSELRFYLEKLYGLSGKDKIFDAVNVAAQKNAFHPVRDYLNSCTWDGTKRLETVFIDYLGAEDNIYTRTVTRKALVAAVARIFRPGCKFDYMLTIRGRQGLGKSAIIAKLAGEWFSDSFTTLQGKEAYEQVQGVWIMEIGELAGLRKAEAETIKLYITKQTDRFRPAYGRRMQSFPRQCIFIGTTNETQFLRDTTGNRRFWILDTPEQPEHDMWTELTPETISQIWAEAVAAFREGERLYLPKDVEAMARDVQSAFEEENPRAGIVAAYLDRKLPVDWEMMDIYQRRQWLEGTAEGTEIRRTACSLEIWVEALGGSPEKFDRYAGKEIRDIMEGLPDWKHRGGLKVTTGPYGRQRYYVRRDWVELENGKGH